MKAYNTILFIAFLIFGNTLLAQSITVQVSADKVQVGEPFLVAYTMDGSVDDFKLPDFKGFEVYESGKSTNVSIVNGKVSKSVTFNITVRPLNVGNFEVGPANAIINGKKVASPPFSIEVSNSSKDPRAHQNQQRSPAAPNSNQRIDAPSENWKENIFLLAQLDKTQAYVGEQVTVTYKLLRRLDYQNMEVDKLPVFKGFLSEEMEIPDQVSEGIMEYKGQRYYYQAFRKVALFPTQSGMQTIDPLTAKGVILIPEIDPFFGTTFFSNTQPKLVFIASNSLKINVLPLPTNAPSNFSGAVGQFQVQRTINSTSIAQDQSATISLEVAGWGNLKAMSAPKLISNKSIEVFEPEIEDQPKKNREVFGGIRKYNYAIVPHSTGKIAIPKGEFVYFDPEQKTYISKELPEIILNVSPKIYNSDIPSTGNQFQDQLKNTFVETRSSSLPLKIAVVSGIPFLAFLGLFVWRTKKREEEERNAPKKFQWPNLNEIPAGNQYSALAQALRNRLKKILKTDKNSDHEVLELIEDASVQQKIGFVLLSCDRVAYSPLHATSIDELKTLAEESLNRIEKQQNLSS
ncbi:MAG TPA: BatD family protein [Chitinophagales bacterium]|nr:BatD family protein [Chitinophagales bacterium]